MPPIVADYIGSIVRTLLAALLGYLVNKGYVSQSQTTELVAYLTGVILVVLWSMWEKYGAKVKFLTALTMPAGTTENAVTSRIASGAVTPTVLTPPNTSPGIPKIVVAFLIVSLSLGAVGSSSCALNQPPAGTYSAQGTRASEADQWLKDLTALSDTAKNLNATTGKLHLKDIDTRYVLDFCASAGSAIQTYGTQGSNLAVVSRGFNALVQSLSVEAKQNSTLAKTLAVVAAFVNNLPQ